MQKHLSKVCFGEYFGKKIVASLNIPTLLRHKTHITVMESIQIFTFGVFFLVLTLSKYYGKVIKVRLSKLSKGLTILATSLEKIKGMNCYGINE
ncbi:hypothetical protein NIES30_09280 [Phormidium tenue NIES-30]|uniref:Uncharacterized protein n=1 Tax=Phormidium tenue NIES-30 TaxID=549789 RepID=A0A1U7J6T9_9CYAN|nr:hypothetical protein NIES30_09280 [Phormidium tenue NIES-30]